MNNVNNKVIDAINNSPWKAYFAITGGGQTFIGDYMSRSGASKTVIGAIVPYSQYAFDKFVKWPIESYASPKAARQLAVAAYNECVAAGVETKYALGLGCACSLAKDDERKGRVHKIHVAVHTRYFTREFNGELEQGRTRQEEEHLVARLLLHALNRCTVQADYTVVPPFDRYNEHTAEGQIYSDVLEKPNVILLSTKFDDEQSVIPIYPGSWNPLHDAHETIAETAESILGVPILFELSIRNADKGQLDHVEISQRVAEVTKRYALAVTNAPTFLEKAKQFRARFDGHKLIFVVGADTWKRIWDPKYAGPPEQLEAIFEEFNIRFLVFGRGTTPIYQGAGERLRIHDKRATEFDMDLSSTALRKQNGN
jgi:nicotinic acid mononucleotide adenylyltransferase